MRDLNRSRLVANYRVVLAREPTPKLDETRVTMPVSAVDVLRKLVNFRLLPVEQFGVLLCNTRTTVVGHVVVSRGTLNGTLVHPREVFAPAIIGNAAAILLYHNHPSGDPSPSHEDRELTKLMRDAGRILRIEVLDHIIVSSRGPTQLGYEVSNKTYYSFKENGGI